ncbi:Uncharacterised protein [uncultured archaeon]|nr:Uncharacterised protein [uncultured archaeon]
MDYNLNIITQDVFNIIVLNLSNTELVNIANVSKELYIKVRQHIKYLHKLYYDSECVLHHILEEVHKEDKNACWIKHTMFRYDSFCEFCKYKFVNDDDEYIAKIAKIIVKYKLKNFELIKKLGRRCPEHTIVHEKDVLRLLKKYNLYNLDITQDFPSGVIQLDYIIHNYTHWKQQYNPDVNSYYSPTEIRHKLYPMLYDNSKDLDIPRKIFMFQTKFPQWVEKLILSRNDDNSRFIYINITVGYVKFRCNELSSYNHYITYNIVCGYIDLLKLIKGDNRYSLIVSRFEEEKDCGSGYPQVRTFSKKSSLRYLDKFPDTLDELLTHEDIQFDKIYIKDLAPTSKRDSIFIYTYSNENTNPDINQTIQAYFKSQMSNIDISNEHYEEI